MNEIYAKYQTTLEVINALAPEIATTINSLAEFITKLKNDVTNYSGGANDATTMKKNFEAVDFYYNALMINKDLDDSTRHELQAAYKDALPTRDFFCNGKECVAINTIKGPHEKLFTESDVCKDNKDKMLKFQAVLEKASNQIVITVDNFCDGIKKSKLDTKYCNRATFLTRGDFPITIENYTSVGFDENGKLFSFTNASGSFERNDAGKYINSENEEAYQTLTPHETDRFYVTSKSATSFEITLKGSTKSKPDFVYKPNVEEEKRNPLNSLVIRISNNNSNIGKFGCWRSDSKSICSYNKGTGNKNHHGVDLMASVGTDALAMFDGKIVEVRGDSFKKRNEKYKNQMYDVNGIKFDNDRIRGKNGCQYAEGSFGKQLIIEYKYTKGIKGIDGKSYSTFYVLYAHLNSLTKTSGKVKAGEKIAECGCSGNAASLSEDDHHLHMEASTSSNDFSLGIKRKIDIEDLIFNQK